MRKRLFIIGVLIISFVLEYLITAYMLSNMDFTFGAGTSFDEMLSCLFLIAVIAIISIVSCICGKRFFKDWNRKNQILMIVAPIISMIVAFFLFVILHP